MGKLFIIFLLLFPIFIGCEFKKKSEHVLGAVSQNAGSVDFPGDINGARKLLLQFLQPGIDKAALTQKLRPNSKDFEAIFKGGIAKQIELAYQEPWEKGQIVIRGKPGQTELLLWSATTEELQNRTGDADSFPGGYVKAAPHFRDNLTFYRFKFVRPGEKLGFAWDGLIFINGHWVIVPKPWRVVP